MIRIWATNTNCVVFFTVSQTFVHDAQLFLIGQVEGTFNNLIKLLDSFCRTISRPNRALIFQIILDGIEEEGGYVLGDFPLDICVFVGICNYFARLEGDQVSD